MSEPIANHFKCINLTQDGAHITTLDACLLGIKKGFHAFYTHGGLINGIRKSMAGSSELLEKVFDCHHAIKKMPVTDDVETKLFDDPSRCPLVLIATASTSKSEVIATFFQALRKILSDDARPETSSFTDSPGFSLNQASSWDLFLEREKYSGLIPGVHDYHEYLLWDDGGCLDSDALNDLSVWHGAGWMDSTLRNQPKSDPWQLIGLGAWFNSASEPLTLGLENLTAFCRSQQKEEPYNLECHTNFVRALCEFLPYHLSPRRNGKYIPSNSLGERGGPMRWRGLLDDRMYLRRRHLLMDGWLTLWPYKQKDGETTMYVQPGSLALLYWAARKMDMPYTGSPEEFLEKYKWDDNHWFGGKWDRNSSKGKING